MPRSAFRGLPESSSSPAECRSYSSAEYCEDHATGLKQLRSLADHGNSEAREFLGVMYSKGKDEGLGLSDDQVSVVSQPLSSSACLPGLLGGFGPMQKALTRRGVRLADYAMVSELFYTR